METRKKAMITGITGQDGSYLAEFLLSKGYDVYGLVRRTSTFNRGRIEHIFSDPHYQERLFLHYGDLLDSNSLFNVINKIKPDEIYNLGAQSHVRISFEMPLYTTETVGLGVLRLLEAVLSSGIKTKVYQASSSEMYGKVREIPQNENTPFYPRSPYAVAKAFGHWVAINHREAHNLFVSCGILFNHESPRRGENFVSKKITMGIAAIAAGKADKIYLGNLDAKRDWGYAPEYVEAMWLMLQQEKPDDYVIATGENHSVKEFVAEAFGLVGIKDWEKHIAINKKYYRPTEVDELIGDARKAERELGWKPKVRFKELVRIMMEADAAELGLTLVK